MPIALITRIKIGGASMKNQKHISISEFFDFDHHPFGDTYVIKSVFLTKTDQRISRQSINLISQGKSFAFTGPSGSGKSTLIRHILNTLDPNSYRICQRHSETALKLAV